jgi:glycine cleavage system aminomethyltransferase T
MPNPAARRSPIHDALKERGAESRLVGGVPFAVRLRDEPTEREAMQSLAICDLSGLQKLGVKGRDAESWLSSEGVEVPVDILESCPFSDGGVTVRFGADEFFLEDGVANMSVASLDERLQSRRGQVFRVEHQEATFLLVGPLSIEVLAQTCGMNFREAPPRQLVLTRVAGVNCAVLPELVGDIPTHRFWVEPSYALYLWEVLVEICESLNGSVVGADIFFRNCPR